MNANSKRVGRASRRWLWWMPVVIVSGAVAAPVADDFESGLGQWQATGLWGTTNLRSRSPVRSATDSPGEYYHNLADSALTLANAVDLTGWMRPVLKFHHDHELENGYDFGRVEVSTDGGATWNPTPLAQFTGSRSGMPREQLDLGGFASATQFKVRFRVVCDATVTMDGWYLDDVVIGEAPAPVVATEPVGGDLGQTHVTLRWTASTDPAFASYVVVRGTSPGFDWRTGKTVATLTDAATVEFTDIAVAPKSSYHYVIMVMNASGLHSASNEVAATTPAGMDYPFLDNGESGPNFWVATAPWALSDEDAMSPGHAWSDSPGGDYADGISSQALALAAPMSFTSAINPTLTFHHRYTLASGDNAVVELSTNGGSSWTNLATFGEGTQAWKPARISLVAYTGQASVLIRFRLTTNASTHADGWHIDDISVAETPASIAAPALSDITSHSLQLIWSASPSVPFSHYAIHRSTNPGVNVFSPRVAVIPDATQTSFIDTALALDTLYYYRIYAVSPYGTYSADSAQEAIARTLNNPIPFTTGFEGDMFDWNPGANTGTSVWGLSTAVKRTGNACLASSPGASYAPNSDTWVDTAVDLRGTDWPVLTFHDRFGLNTGDWIRLEISAAGGPTLYPYGAHESSRSDWQQQRVDLSPWKGLANVKLRFRLAADNAATPGEGWFIDDLEVEENPNRNNLLTLPFTEDFESAGTGWLLSGWTASADAAAKDGANVLQFGSPTTHIGPDCQLWAVLDRPVILPTGSKVQVTYWVRGSFAHYAYHRFMYSTNGGVGWAEFSAVNRDHVFNSLGSWLRSQAALDSLAGQQIRLRFQMSSVYGSAPSTDCSVDKFTLAQIPAPVALTSTIPALRSVDLTWTTSPLGSSFLRYEVWRSTAANVSFTNGQKIFESTDIETNQATDTGLNIGGTYYYRVFTVDDRDTYTPSNEMSTTTVPVAIPFTDAMDAMDNWVSGSNNATASTWAVRTDEKHGGTGSLATVAVGQYAQAADNYIETAVDLRGTDWPVLAFWDRHDLNTGDWIRLEISAAGGPTLYPYGAHESSRSEWRQQRVDLSPWKGLANVKLRFHLAADNAATPGEGWFIDDLEVAENPNRNNLLTLPFTEDFESAGTGWLLSGWTASADAAAKDGANVLHFGSPTTHIGPDCQLWAVLDRPVILPAGSKVQVTYWVRGSFAHYAYHRFMYSANGGVGWAEFSAVNRDHVFNSLGSWLRSQAALDSLAGQQIRLRFQMSSVYGSAPTTDCSVDKFTLAQIPAPVALTSTIPALRSVDLTWTTSPLGSSFLRYEVWRSTAANVSFTNGQKIFETTNIDTIQATDTGLNIGGTYYYRVFTVDDRDTYSPSNEMSTTTVPKAIPFTDAMDAMDNWVSGSNNTTASTWAVRTDEKHGGTGSLATVAVGQYAQAADNYIETAVDLRGTDWPVLAFWDRHDLNTGDWIRLEISAAGGPTLYPYGTYASSRSEWRQQRVDLSPWKGLANVKLRFHLAADNAATPGEGWFIDDLEVAENPNRNNPLTLPFTEDFESAGTGWLLSGWTTSADAAAKDGAKVLQFGSPTTPIGPDCQLWAVLDRPVILPTGSKVQATYWVRGSFAHYAYHRFMYSTNGGVGWAEFSSVNRDYVFNSLGSWLRSQAALDSLAGQQIRLRFQMSSVYGSVPSTDCSVDKFTLAEMPAPVAMLPIDEVAITTMRLNWNPSPLDTFRRYEVYRSTTSAVSNASTLVGTITDRETGTFTDTGLQARNQYFYRVYMVDDRDTYSPSDVVSATTLGVGMPFADDFSSARAGWTFTGQWQIQTGVGRDGGAALVDSPGDYLANTDTDARIAVNLDGTQWPVLRYWDKHRFAGSSWGRVEISSDNASWSLAGGVTEIRDTWQMQVIDLSQWRNQTRVFIRFHRGTDANLSDGWTIDDLSISDRGLSAAYPVSDGFESGTIQWLAGSWTTVSDSPLAGAGCLQDTPNRRYGPDTPQIITLAKEVDLTTAVDPQLTFFIRGYLTHYSYFRVQVSTDHGLGWADLPACNRDYVYNSTAWQKQQVSFTPYKGKQIRIRFITGSNYGSQPTSDIFIDNLGIGEPMPGAPVPVTPFENQTVDIKRPTLTVINAIDYQSDALTHQFEVYADAALTQLAAQVPSVASGATQTSWQVDVDLPDHQPYWWRARASDGVNTGAWTTATVFNINEVNNPPLPPVIAAPANDSLLIDGNGMLVWFQSFDPDLGDEVRDYQIQIDNDVAFGSPEVDHAGITIPPATYGPGFLASIQLGDLPGSENLPSGRWFWRVRARDTRFSSGGWSTGYAYFRFPTKYQRYLRTLYPDPDWFLYDVSNPGADPDGNKVGVMWEFACGIAPGTAPGNRLPVAIEVEKTGNRHQGFECTRRKDSEMQFMLKTSTDLKTWETDTRATVEILYQVDATSERIRMIDPDPIGSHRRRFINLYVSD